MLNEFVGATDIHGTEREVAFSPSYETEPSVLSIRGLTIEDAVHVLATLNGGLLKGKDAEPPPKAAATKTTKKKEPELTLVKEEPVRKAESLADPEPEPEPDVDEDDELDGDDGGTKGTDDLDVEAMGKMTKLREVIEYMADCGHDTAEKVVEIAQRYVKVVPLLAALDAKGGFAKRLERNALVALEGYKANNVH